MVQDMLYCVSFRDDSGTEGAGAEMLAAFDYDMSSWRDEESKVIHHTLYFQSVEDADNAAAFLKNEVENWREFGIELCDMKRAELRKEDWAESWKIHFKPMVISPRLAIAPSWSDFKPGEGQELITLDPGMSFGTGQHATTKFCLSAIDKFSQELIEKGNVDFKMLDAGSGSGILFIAASKLGAAKADAFDIDPDTIEVAKENAAINFVPEEKYSVKACSLMEFSSENQYEIVVANILSSALIQGKEKLLSCCMDGGVLILAGILHTEYEKVRAEFESTGKCSQLYSFQEQEWRGGAFRITK